MKRFSKVIVALLILFSGIFVAACGEPADLKIVLSAESVVINLGEDSATQIVNAKPVGIDVNSLSLAYDNTYFEISSSGKLSDGSFDLTVTSKGDMPCEDIEVTVKAGSSVQTSFKVSIVIPLNDITVNNNLFVAFDGNEDVVLNLLNETTFDPIGTEQKNVEFLIYDENQQKYVSEIEMFAKVVDGYLIVNKEVKTFGKIKLMVQSLDNSTISKEFEVEVIPSTKFFAEHISMVADFGGGYSNASAIQISDINDSLKGVNLSINKAGSIYELSTFNLKVTIPKALGVAVDVDSDSANNVMAYLTVNKTSYPVGENIVTEFAFDSLNLKSCLADLYLKFYYEAENLKNINKLSSCFVKTDNGVEDSLKVYINVPVDEIAVYYNKEINTNNNTTYTIYNSYSGTGMGSEFIFTTVPVNATEQTFKVVTMDNVRLNVWNSAENCYDQLAVDSTFIGGSTIYIAGDNSGVGSLKLACGTKEITLNFVIKKGASLLGFVSAIGESDFEFDKTVYIESGVPAGTDVYLYAPGTNETDLICDGLTIEPVGDNYYKITLTSNQVGTKDYTIATENGYSIKLTAITIDAITEATLKIASGSENSSSIGKAPVYDVNSGDLKELAVKYGFTVPLEYQLNNSAEISGIKYGFVDMVIGKDIVTPYTLDYYNFVPTEGMVYGNSSVVISSQNIKNANLVTG
ncbi:MAG: hypothetical protein IJW25_00905, partial [Clostridia bacterium]|nr:hypothetical protein [Clostridia bacterium]